MAPAIATPVASSTLPDMKYTARKTMVEKKSVPSLANTSFIVVFSFGVSRRAGRAPARQSGSAAGAQPFTLSWRAHRTGGRRELGDPVSRIPSGEIDRAVAGGERNRDPGPQRQARYIDQQHVGRRHQQVGGGPRP